MRIKNLNKRTRLDGYIDRHAKASARKAIHVIREAKRKRVNEMIAECEMLMSDATKH